MKIKRILLWVIGSVGAIIILFLVLVWFTTYHPDEMQQESVTCSKQAPVLKPGQSLKVLSWNVQYMAGKNYFFYYDALDTPGPDERPSAEDVGATLREVARIINAEDPDIILLQEVDDGAKRTDYRDQLADLLPMISDAYLCQASADVISVTEATCGVSPPAPAQENSLDRNEFLPLRAFFVW